ncbi:S-layer homology domain-containing protein [Demequina sp. NBRC 110055]|uniref:S-layer homology domain-containing protein n=1 Tax=Demequina sp. NBRC 110055 TaxID=1570344 RepID=UPI0013564313|nr:S-layer homology domain-containing protein [Demequina sp. NBRC 110055]
MSALVAALVAAVTMTTAAPAAHAALQFPDVPPSHQFATEIDWLAQQHITTGYSDGDFRPRDHITREAFAAFVYRLAGEPYPDRTALPWWRDVPTGHQFFREIWWVSEAGITRGFADGFFHPDEDISREAVAAFLYRFEGSPRFTAPARSPFSDVKPSAKFYKEITWLASTGMTTGFADGTFRPTAAVTREAVAAFMYRGYAVMPHDGFYAVGTGRGEVAPGIYTTSPRSGGECVWEHRDVPASDHRPAGTSSWAASDFGPSIVEITSADTSFSTDGCTPWRELRVTNPHGESFGRGDHLVGYDIGPGVYTAPGGSNCVWVTYANFRDAPDSELHDGAGRSPKVIVTDGIWSRGCGTWTWSQDVGAIPRS